MTSPFPTVSGALNKVAETWLPRLMTQVCRDPTAPQYGCFDRDWWHYRIRDFPSIILQQGGYALHLASQMETGREKQQGLGRLAAAACHFWNARAGRRGAFEEYYPWEQGYPPLAFSTLAVMKLAAEKVVDPAEVRTGAIVAIRQLESRFESRAANQQIAGLAALAWCRRNFPDLVSPAGFESLVQRSLALQNREGWFEEYGGPDLGYLSVTVDCLWDLFDATGDTRFLAAIERAVDCIRRFAALMPEGSIGMHNSRNTDYLVPYGLVRLALHRPTNENVALIAGLFGGAENSRHFLNAVDDRYVSHYIGQSLFRALLLLEQAPEISVTSITRPAAGESGPSIELLTESGHFLRKAVDRQRSLVTLRKGGIFTHHAAGGTICDYGWVVETEQARFISHWWSGDWKYGRDQNLLWVEGALYEHKDVASTPGRHMALRVASRLAGNRLIGMLKKKLIFEKRRSLIGFRRTIEWLGDAVRVVDVFTNIPQRAKMLPAPRSSKRHVASADSFHREDLRPVAGFNIARQFNPSGRNLEIITTYTRISEERRS